MKNQTKVIKKDAKLPHRLYATFTNAKSVMLELARTIASESDTVPRDVQRVLDEQAKKS